MVMLYEIALAFSALPWRTHIWRLRPFRHLGREYRFLEVYYTWK